MNKIEKLANLKYNDDINKAMEYLIEYGDKQVQTSYYNDMTKSQKNKYTNIAFKCVNRAVPGGLVNTYNKLEILDEFNLTENELKQMNKNPYGAEVKKSFFKFLLGNLALFATQLIPGASQLAIAFGAVETVLSFAFAKKLLDYFKFRKAKKMINSEKYQKQIEEAQKEVTPNFFTEDELNKELDSLSRRI